MKKKDTDLKAHVNKQVNNNKNNKYKQKKKKKNHITINYGTTTCDVLKARNIQPYYS